MLTYVSFVTGTMEENPPAAKKQKFCLTLGEAFDTSTWRKGGGARELTTHILDEFWYFAYVCLLTC